MLGDKATGLVAAGLFGASIIFGRRAVKSSRNKSSQLDDAEAKKDNDATTNGKNETSKTKQEYRHPNTAPIQPRIIHPHAYYLKHAQQIRLALDPLRQSQFRVVCILLLESGSVIVGTNDEASPNIAGAICAERAALLAYRMQFTRERILMIYIVTDSDTPIPPGTLCREYLYGHSATTPETTFILQSNDGTSQPWIVTLQELYPYPSLYNGMSSQQQVAFGRAHESIVEQLLADFVIPGLVLNDQIIRLVGDAHQAALGDGRTTLHPMQYGAAAVIRVDDDKLEYWQASQQKALEYGSTQDAVGQLLAVIRAREQQLLRRENVVSGNDSRPSPPMQVICIVMVDQFGIPHVPFAPARSLLVEHDLGDVQVLLTTQSDDGRLRLRSVAARELCPFMPDFCKEESQSAQNGKAKRNASQDMSRLTLIEDNLRRETTRNVRNHGLNRDSWGIDGQESSSRLEFSYSVRQ